jgi:hypothetical protein
VTNDASAADSSFLRTSDFAAAILPAPAASPAHYVDFTFAAESNTRYRLWLRLRAEADSKYNDSLYVQFSDSVNANGAPVYRIGTTAGLTVNLATCATCPPHGWGWQNRAYWLNDTGDVWFAAAGSHTIRIQAREDGVGVDQIVLSPSQYVDSAPGTAINDATIVPKPTGTSPPPPPPPPNAAPTITLTSPADGATFTAPSTITVSATANDVDGGIARVDFYAGGALIGSDTTAPYSVAWTNIGTGSYTLTADAIDDAGATTISAPVRITIAAPQTVPSEVVIYANEIPASGGWTIVNDAGAAAGLKLFVPDQNWSNTNGPLAAPTRYFDVTFSAEPNTRYRLWLRLRADGDSKYNDSVYVQFSDAVNAAGAAVYGIGTTAGLTVNLATCGICPPQGWGWQNRAYWLSDTGEVWFASSGSHTMRVQLREDGVGLDQIVLSPKRYLDTPPGTVTNDTTIVPKP